MKPSQTPLHPITRFINKFAKKPPYHSTFFFIMMQKRQNKKLVHDVEFF